MHSIHYPQAHIQRTANRCVRVAASRLHRLRLSHQNIYNSIYGTMVGYTGPHISYSARLAARQIMAIKYTLAADSLCMPLISHVQRAPPAVGMPDHDGGARYVTDDIAAGAADEKAHQGSMRVRRHRHQHRVQLARLHTCIDFVQVSSHLHGIHSSWVISLCSIRNAGFCPNIVHTCSCGIE